ncbi:MAG TPA: ATP-binding protein [Acidothermaceae bacterium]|jgi:serine/threonine-protein kinase RsbW|nr:ATP-binding protein [Acidothermaceae bacterium]
MHLQLRLLLPGEERSVPVVRKVLSHALGVLGVERACIEDVELAISEACTNVLDHAGPHDEYVVVAGVDDDQCVIEICDEGVNFSEPPPATPGTLVDPEAEHGRGVQLMRALVDRLDFAVGDGSGTVVRLQKSLTFARVGV